MKLSIAVKRLALFNEAESVAKPDAEKAEEEVVAPPKRRGKRKPLPADPPRIEVIHEQNHGVDIPRQTRRVIQCGEHLQPLLNLMRDQLLESRVIQCDETRV